MATTSLREAGQDRSNDVQRSEKQLPIRSPEIVHGATAAVRQKTGPFTERQEK